MNFLTKIQDQIFKIFDDSDLSDEGKCKILAQLIERFGFLLNKFKHDGLPLAQILQPRRVVPLPAPDEHVGDGLPVAVVEADKEDFFLPVEPLTQRNARFPLTLFHVQGPLRISLPLLMLHF